MNANIYDLFWKRVKREIKCILSAYYILDSSLKDLTPFVCPLFTGLVGGIFTTYRCSQVVLVVKSPPANAGDARDTGSTPGSGRSPGVGNGNLLQYSCLENSMNRTAWQATVHGVARSWT